MKHLLFPVSVLSLLFVFAGCQTSPTPPTPTVINNVIFTCTDHKKIHAVFYNDHVAFALSDGRNMELPQTISADGARYANSDESIVFWNKGDTAFLQENGKDTYQDCTLPNTNTNTNTAQATNINTNASAGIANPASVNCTKQGGKIEIKENPSGGQYGICYFLDNRQCEEWALFRGECPVGGLKITGYENDAEVYCAITGGTVKMNTKPVTCELPKSAGTCSVNDYFSKGNDCVSATPPVAGGDKDKHGCIGSAGYTWCASTQKCIRSWEEKCPLP